MLKGIKTTDIWPYTLEEERDAESPTVWWLKPQTVAKGNRPLAAYMQAHQKKDLDTVSRKTTQADLDQWLSTVDHVDNFCFSEEEMPREEIRDPEDLKKIFFQLDISSYNELMNASRDIFRLKDGQKKGSSSSSGAAS